MALQFCCQHRSCPSLLRAQLRGGGDFQITTTRSSICSRCSCSINNTSRYRKQAAQVGYYRLDSSHLGLRKGLRAAPDSDLDLRVNYAHDYLASSWLRLHVGHHPLSREDLYDVPSRRIYKESKSLFFYATFRVCAPRGCEISWPYAAKDLLRSRLPAVSFSLTHLASAAQ